MADEYHRTHSALHLSATSCLSMAVFQEGVIPPDYARLVAEIRDTQQPAMRRAYRMYLEPPFPPERQEAAAQEAFDEMICSIVQEEVQGWPGFVSWRESPSTIITSIPGGRDGQSFIGMNAADTSTFGGLLSWASGQLESLLLTSMLPGPLGWSEFDRQDHIRHARLTLADAGAVGQRRIWMGAAIEFLQRGIYDSQIQSVTSRCSSMCFDVTSFTPGAEERLGLVFFPPSHDQGLGGAYVHGGFIKFIPGGGGQHYIMCFENGLYLAVLPVLRYMDRLTALLGALRLVLWRDLVEFGLHPSAHPTRSNVTMSNLKIWSQREDLVRIKKQIDRWE